MRKQWGKALDYTLTSRLIARRPDPFLSDKRRLLKPPTSGVSAFKRWPGIGVIVRRPDPFLSDKRWSDKNAIPGLLLLQHLPKQLPQYATAQGRDPSPLKKEMRQWCLAPRQYAITPNKTRHPPAVAVATWFTQAVSVMQQPRGVPARCQRYKGDTMQLPAGEA